MNKPLIKEILTYSIPKPIPFSNQSPILSPINGHQEKSFGNIGEIKSGFNFLGFCALLAKLTIIPTARQKRQGIAENHMYETS